MAVFFEMDICIGQVCVDGKLSIVLRKGTEFFKLGDGAPTVVLDLLKQCDLPHDLSRVIEKLVNHYGLQALENIPIQLMKPVNPPEVWAVGVTYQRQALEHDADLERRKGLTDHLYHFAYSSYRAEIFFKGFDRTCCGPGEAITLRADSVQVMPEAELVLVLGRQGLPIAYTLGNDLTAWDIECDCPLFLNQAKIWDGSAAVGPWLVPADLLDPYACCVICEVERQGKTVLCSEGNTSGLKRSIEELCFFLNFNNLVPVGTLLFTGTACIVPHNFGLEDGDIVSIRAEGFGELKNPVCKLRKPNWEFIPRRGHFRA